jgi:hypothetical protein
MIASCPSGAASQPDCTARLALIGIKAEHPAAIPAPAHAACVLTEPVVLISVTAFPGPLIRYPDHPLLSCAMALRLARFSADIAAPMALKAFGKPLASLSTGPGYECRPRNRLAGAKISSHGQGNAVDIMVLELSGALKIVVEKPEGAAVMKFLADFRTAACVAFNTVLGPGSDPSHASHIHLDAEPRGKTGNSKFCQ